MNPLITEAEKLDAILPGVPRVCERTNEITRVCGFWIIEAEDHPPDAYFANKPDGDFYVSARTLIPQLAAALKQAEARIAELERGRE